MTNSILVPLIVVVVVVGLVVFLNHAEFRAVFRRRMKFKQRKDE